ncbi:MAG: BatD family protein [Acidobacteriota bacterium]
MVQRRHRLRCLSVLMLLVLLPYVVNVEGWANSQAKLRVSADRGSVTVGDHFRLKIEVEHSKNTSVSLPSLEGRLGKFKAYDVKSLPQKDSGSDQIIDSWEIDLAAFQTGKLEIPSLPLEVVNAQGQGENLATEPVVMEVQSVLKEGDQTLRDLKPQARIPVAYQRLLLMAMVAAALGALIYLLLRRLRRKPKVAGTEVPRDTRSFEEIARQSIHALVARRLVESGQLKEFFLELSEIMKRYLGCKQGILWLERTSEEFCFDLKRSEVPFEEFWSIREFLAGCDLVKFAKYRPARDEIDRLIQQAFHIIDRVEKTHALELIGPAGS